MSAKRNAGRDFKIELVVVSRIGDPHILLIIAAGCIFLGVISQLMQENLRFPFLTFTNFFASTTISIIGGLGDHRRSSLL